MKLAALALLLMASPPALAQASERFSFHDMVSLTDMQSMIQSRLPLGSDRARVRRFFIGEGGATLKAHPAKANVEKYIYDINLCELYVWRWNISADYDANGRTTQLYVNGEPLFGDGTLETFVPGPAPAGKKSAIIRGQRPRPEARKGESSLAYILYDLDGDLKTIHDQQLIGGGPTRADPNNPGKLHVYRTHPWRSIFDPDEAARIAPYRGPCPSTGAAAG